MKYSFRKFSCYFFTYIGAVFYDGFKVGCKKIFNFMINPCKKPLGSSFVYETIGWKLGMFFSLSHIFYVLWGYNRHLVYNMILFYLSLKLTGSNSFLSYFGWCVCVFSIFEVANYVGY